MRWKAKSITILLATGAIASPGCQAEGEATSEGGATSEALALSGSSLGMAVDNLTGTATVFNADTNTVLGTVPALGGVLLPGDCSITADGTKGFFTPLDFSVTVADLTQKPPTLAGGPNPIPISNLGVDTALSPDGRFLVVADDTVFRPLSVIDVATQTQISTFDLGEDSVSVEICSDGSVLAGSFSGNHVRRLTLSGSGTLTDTGESVFASGPINVYCSPSGASGVVLSLFDNSATSFKIPGMTPVSTHDLGIVALSGAINHAGDRAYFLDLQGGVTAFSFDQATGVLGATPLFQVPVASPVGPFGIDQVAVHRSDATLYVPAPEGLRILDAQTGATTGSITGGSLGTTAGICFGAGGANQPPVARCADRIVPADGTCHADASIDDGSFDPDNGDTFQCTQVPSGPYGEGTTAVTLTCTDSHGASSSCTANVTVVDATPPTVVTTTPAPLWPPNHKYHRIGLPACIASIQDACGGPLDIASHAKITACTSAEPDDGLGDGDTPDDCVIADDHSVDARAERAGGGNGRVYTIHFAVSDGAGNATDHTCTVTVPLSQNGDSGALLRDDKIRAAYLGL